MAVRPVNEDWLIDEAPRPALRVASSVFGQVRNCTVESPVDGVLVVTHRYVTPLVAIASIVLVPLTVGLSLLALAFAKSTNRMTVRAEPDGDGTRLVLEGRMPAGLLDALHDALGLGDPR